MGSLRTRYLVTSLFTLGLLALGAVAHAAEAGDGRRDPARFTSDALALHAAGWTLADVGHDDAPARGEGAVDAQLTLVDPARTHALRLSLEFVAYGDQLVGYTREDVAVPEERRIYDHEDTLFEGLAHGAVQKFYDECGSPVLGLVGGDAALGEYDWHIVERRVEGDAAAAALGEELRRRLRAGAHVAEVHESEQGVAFVLVDEDADGASRTHVLEARLEATGRVLALEVSEAPSAWSSGQLSRPGRLTRGLRGRTLSRVSLSHDEGATRVRLDFTRGKGIVIDVADIVYPDDEGCGC
jgi:hypothetical protein